MTKLTIRRRTQSTMGTKALTGALAVLATLLAARTFPDLRRYVRIKRM